MGFTLLTNLVEFLKSCGTILETPVELRKAYDKIIAQPPGKDVTSFNASSRVSGIPLKKLVWDEQEDSDFTQKTSACFWGNSTTKAQG